MFINAISKGLVLKIYHINKINPICFELIFYFQQYYANIYLCHTFIFFLLFVIQIIFICHICNSKLNYTCSSWMAFRWASIIFLFSCNLFSFCFSSDSMFSFHFLIFSASLYSFEYSLLIGSEFYLSEFPKVNCLRF